MHHVVSACLLCCMSTEPKYYSASTTYCRQGWRHTRRSLHPQIAEKPFRGKGMQFTVALGTELRVHCGKSAYRCTSIGKS